MALLASEAQEIYTWLSAGWPTVIRPGASAEFVAVKVRELMKDFAGYTKDEVLEGIDRWRQRNEAYPKAKNIINEIEWARRERLSRKRETDPEAAEGWPMEVIYDNGDEACFGVFDRERFVNHPKNSSHLQPEEWRRRFRIRRAEIDAKLGRISRERYEAFTAKMKALRAAEEASA